MQQKNSNKLAVIPEIIIQKDLINLHLVADPKKDEVKKV